VRLRLIERDDDLGSDAGVRAAVHAHSGELFGFALRTLGDQGLAEEVVQETFVRAWRAGRRFDPDIASLRTWLFAILRNVIVDATRARSIRPGVGAAVDVAVADNIDEL
jgi:RNA polymerase sigma-70 factor (ECF subfamily)